MRAAPNAQKCNYVCIKSAWTSNIFVACEKNFITHVFCTRTLIMHACSANVHNHACMLRTSVESEAQTYHRRFGAGRRMAGRRGGAGRGRPGCRRVGSPRRRRTLLPSRASNTTVLDVSSEAPTYETLCIPMEGQNLRLARG